MKSKAKQPSQETDEKTLATPFQRTIKANGRTFYYCFKQAPYPGLCKAYEIFEHHSLRKLNRPRTMPELEIGGGYDYKLDALAVLLLEVKTEGGKTTYERPLWDDARKWLESLTGEEWPLLEECITDFFRRAKLRNVERLLGYAITWGLAEVASWPGRLLQSSGVSSLGTKSESPDSTSQENTSDV